MRPGRGALQAREFWVLCLLKVGLQLASKGLADSDTLCHIDGLDLVQGPVLAGNGREGQEMETETLTQACLSQHRDQRKDGRHGSLQTLSPLDMHPGALPPNILLIPESPSNQICPQSGGDF